MRNREAARYASWAAMAAAAIALVVAGVYVRRAIRRAQARRSLPVNVAATVQQQSAEFSFSKVEQNRTLFTVRASRATQYKDQNRALLEDVWITLYGRDGTRNDNIHTRECSYEPDSGLVRCEGEVTIDVQGARPTPGKSPGSSLQIKTSNLSFNRESGEASTPAPVEFQSPQGQGHGVGITYDARESVVTVDHDVAFDLAPAERTGGLAAGASGSKLEIRQNEHRVVLDGPALVREGDRELSADRIIVELDHDYRARRVLAEGHPQIRSTGGLGKLAISAEHFDARLDPAGWIESISADGNVTAQRDAAGRVDRFAAPSVQVEMIPQRNLAQRLTASGGVSLESRQGNDARSLKTDALRINFSQDDSRAHSSAQAPRQMMDRQSVESVETLAPATIRSSAPGDAMTLSADKFMARLDPNGHLDKLLGHAHVEVRRQIGNAVPQLITASEMVAVIGERGQWETLDESGDVRFQQGDRRATADRAAVVRATDAITLDGSIVISDAMSRTTAGHAVINQKSGDLLATGGVVSTYLATAKGDAVGFGAGAAHISADGLSGSATSAQLKYSGHARLWQGASVLDADQIELWRDEKKMQASGHITAVFPQAAGQFPTVEGGPQAKTAGTANGTSLWKVTAPMLTYWADPGKAHFEEGVTASSAQGSLTARTIDVFLDLVQTSGGRQLGRVLAQGDTVVRQGERKASAEQAEYTSADGKFVLSGGEPTITDDSSNTITGRSLTFFVASDTILIDSREGSRTLTKHRIEK